MTDFIIEYATNLFQGFMFIGFLFLFFNHNQSKRLNITAFILFSLLLFSSICIFSNEIFYTQHIDSLVYIVIMEIYVLLFCSGNLFIRLIMPPITFLMNTILSYITGYAISYLSGYSYLELATNSSAYRLLCIVIINITNLFVYYIIIKIWSKKLTLNKGMDIFSFIVMPLIATAIIYSTLQILHLSGYKQELLGYLIAICLAVAVICVISWILLDRISKSYKIKTQLLLTKQRENMYRNNTILMHDQIDHIAKIKHDMKNNLLCIDELLSTGQYEQARTLCNRTIQDLNSAYIPLHTDNPYLNAVINVELEKALLHQVDMVLDIRDDMLSYADLPDVISIIGNMCDNAIEYLSTIEPERRQMKLSIIRKANYYMISCKNQIDTSIISENPSLRTAKNDKEFHGKGIEIIREKAQKYNGNINIYEKDSHFTLTAFLGIKSLPEK